MSTTTPTDTTTTVRPDHLYVCADTTPGVHRIDSEESATGRDAIFDSCQCLAGGAR